MKDAARRPVGKLWRIGAEIYDATWAGGIRRLWHRIKTERAVYRAARRSGFDRHASRTLEHEIRVSVGGYHREAKDLYDDIYGEE